ncbi:rSAM/selenodomain-associated transferase 2 [Algoriphagus aquaeductus]|uniref:RSAM/selenodomain-associated transferase 2 n=1 Tax=Algoriphagus aquaeductus TaxID=475299 RepID=A0A326RLY3_9BACT|nr:TIGR04283 family arsenosugar biosynthesis glycosyltransferase [Algoriphagus aquaeductus]PZV80272.1 rSAM/selenodomain-associated transferase 2 [Algoriphagus aquaeductus]
MNDILRLSVIIPVLNESQNLKELLPLLKRHGGDFLENLIVVDGGSTDGSVETASQLGAQVFELKEGSRAKQMNLGASKATGNTLFFVHADTRPLPSFAEDIQIARLRKYKAGCYRYQFESSNPLLRLNGWATRFNGLFSGGGDQTLFISKKFFDALGGFDSSYCLMEDFELVRRIKKKTSFYIIPKSIRVSARKYEHNSWLRVQLVNLYVFLKFHLGTSPQELKSIYLKHLHYD